MKRRTQFARLGVEDLESRAMLTTAGLVSATQQIVSAPVQTLPTATQVASSMVTYLNTQVGKRIGAGECADVPTEALRRAGGVFVINTTVLDYVWSGNMVTSISGRTTGGPVYSKPTNPIKPGDIIQYTNTKFSNGVTATHHTSVVAAVNSSGKVTQVFEQNIGKVINGTTQFLRYVNKDAIDFAQLTAGYVKIYRPGVRVPTAGNFQFTVVNNADAAQAFTVKFATTSFSPVTLQKANVINSFTTYSCSGTGASFTITVGSSVLTVQDAAGYEIYKVSTGKYGVRKLV
jgi:hypothetical protein